MDSGSRSVERNEVVEWEVGPTNEVVKAFMEFLVDPRLPRGVSATEPLSDDAHKSIARQMHAVVLLYNYYHRKQKPELEFLDFVSFCKLAVSLRPNLGAFMKFSTMESNGAADQLSVTEIAVKNACNIALALDASISIPNTEGWPISKVAALLIDETNDNCRLQFGAVTEGVWSTYEKDIPDSYTSNEVGSGGKRKRYTKFLQLAYDVVKEATGIESSDLVLLGAHDAYSLSKEKSTTRVYLLRWRHTFNIRDQVPIKILLTDLQGPLAEKDFAGWIRTRVVEYHHMLPYLRFITRWLSRTEPCSPSLTGSNAQNRISAPPGFRSSGKDLEAKPKSCDKVVNHNSDSNQKKYKQSSGGEAMTAAEVVQLPTNKLPFFAVKDISNSFLINSDTGTNKFKSFCQSMAKDCSAVEEISKVSASVDSAKNKESNKLEILGADIEDSCNDC